MSRDSWYQRLVLALLAPLLLLAGFRWNPCLCGHDRHDPARQTRSCCAQPDPEAQSAQTPCSHGPGCQMDKQAGHCRCASLSASTTSLASTAPASDLRESVDHAAALPVTVTPEFTARCPRVGERWRDFAGRSSGSPPTFILNCTLRC